MKNQYHFSKQGDTYLVYAPESGQEIVMNLAGDGMYTLQVLDTWGMEINEEKPIASGEFRFTTSDPYTALKIVR